VTLLSFLNSTRSRSRSGFAKGGLELRRTGRRPNQNCAWSLQLRTAFVHHFCLNDAN